MKHFTTFLFLAISFSGLSQNQLTTDYSFKFSTRYLLRGKLYTQSPIMQPMVTASLGNFFAMLEGVYTLSKDEYQETNLYLGYSNKYFSLTLADYFGHANINQDLNYFNWKEKSTPHILETILNLRKVANTNFNLKTAMMFYGIDKDIEGKNNYSMYCEINYTYKKENFMYTPFIGLTPYQGSYADNFAFINIGSTLNKEIILSDKIKLTAFCTFCVNPYRENAICVAGISL